MAQFPAFPLWTDAYLADTTHLTTLEHGAYLLLLMAMWRSKEKRLPNDDRMLARYAGLKSNQWQKIKPTIMEFFTADGDFVTQGRILDEAYSVAQKSKKQSHRAKSRWLKSKESGSATADPRQCHEDASLTLNPITEREEEGLENNPPRAREASPDPALRLIEIFDGELTAAFGENLKRGWAAGDDFVIAKRWLEAGLDPEDFKFLCQSRMRKKARNGDKPPSCLKYLDTAVQDLIRTGQLESSDRPDWRTKPRTKSQIAG